MAIDLKKAALIGALAGGTVATAVLFRLDPATTPIYPECQFHRLTGLDCPGCGSLRALHELLHGHLLAALHLNLLLVLSLPLFALLAARFIWRVTRGMEPVLDIRPSWAWAYVAAWVVFGIVRNLPCRPFLSFAP
jgi:hypothetical protein